MATMARKFKTVNYEDVLKQTVTIEERVPPGHLARFIVQVITTFDLSADHRDIPLSNLRRLAEVGLETWLTEQEARYRCPTCGKPVDIYSETCRACGAELPER